MPEKHALLSASSSHRWIHCPPSARIAAKHPDTAGEAAKEGTAAHALAEWKLRKGLGEKPGRRPRSKWQDQAMDDHTTDYAEYVQGKIATARQACPDPMVQIEYQVNYSHIAPEGFGTADCLIIAEPVMYVIDLKYGKGVKVDAERNSQLRLYAAGALNEFRFLYDIREIETTIFQPRLGNVVSETVTVGELDAWAEYVKPIARTAWNGRGRFAAGEWCQFCPIAATCRERTSHALSVAKHEFAPPPELTVEELADVFPKLAEVKKWAEKVEKHMLGQALAGTTYPGLKVVEGRSNRRYGDETKIVETLTQAGVEDFTVTKLKTITELEKQVGKKQFSELLNGLIEKPRGKPVLVLASDKREEYQVTPGQDFQKLDD